MDPVHYELLRGKYRFHLRTRALLIRNLIGFGIQVIQERSLFAHWEEAQLLSIVGLAHRVSTFLGTLACILGGTYAIAGWH